MTKKLIRELPLWVLIALPVLYLISTWENIPAEVPLHYSITGEADRWGSKSQLYWIMTVIPLLIYGILLVAKRIDPKKKISEMGSKFYILRFGFTLFLAVIFLLMIHSQASQRLYFESALFALIGVIFLFMGNYFRSMRPNYFLGYRTPWTLENDEVWRLTHRHSSVVWVIGGLIMLIVNIWLPLTQAWGINITIILLLLVDPLLYSYIVFRQNQPS